MTMPTWQSYELTKPREVQALPDCQESDEDANLPPVAVDASAAISCTPSLEQRFVSKELGEVHMTMLESLESAMMRSIL